jgi:regulator of sigma E protease
VDVFVAIVGLGFLILVHEAGHFFASLAVGMRPRRFYVGFPPALVKTTRRGIEYGIGAIPLGGFVTIPGMHRPAPFDADTYFGPAVREEPSLVQGVEALKRHLAAGDLAAATAALGPLREALRRASISPAARRSADRGLTQLADALGPDAYWRAPTWKRVVAIFAGPGTNLVFAIVVFAILFMVGTFVATTKVGDIQPGHPAASAGLRAGDQIVAIDGRQVNADQIPERIRASHGKPVVLTVMRDDEQLRIGPVRPKLDQGAFRLGFTLAGKGLGPAAATWRSFGLTWDVTKEIGASLGRLVHGQGRKDISSPVGIVQASSQQLRHGVQDYLSVLGLISLSLALLNLLPLLPLDGGHIAFSIIEGLRGRAVRREVYERVSAVGIALVLLLFFVGLTNDIGRLNGG